MRRRVQIEASLPYPPERVFPYLADPCRWPEFAPAVASRRRIGDGHPTVGSRWSAVDRIGPFPIRFTDELLEVDPDVSVAWASSSPWNSLVVYRLRPERDGTRILATYEGDVAGWLLRLVAMLPTWVLARILMRDFHGLRRCLDAEAPAGADLDVALG
jgi:hypothetical protein